MGLGILRRQLDADERGGDALVSVDHVLGENDALILADIEIVDCRDVVGVARFDAARDVLAAFAKSRRFVLDADVVGADQRLRASTSDQAANTRAGLAL